MKSSLLLILCSIRNFKNGQKSDLSIGRRQRNYFCKRSRLAELYGKIKEKNRNSEESEGENQ